MLKSFLYIISFFLICTSCKKETGVAGPAGAAGINGLDGSLLDTGTLTGNLAVYDEFSWPISDSSGVKVSLKSGGAIITTNSDHSGNYTFHGLPSGTYNLSYEKANFGTMKVFGISHSPGSDLHTVVPEVYLMQNTVKTAIDSISMFASYDYVNLTIYLDTTSLSYTQPPQNFVLLIGNDPHPTIDNTEISPLSEFIVPNPQGSYSFSIAKEDLGGVQLLKPPYYITVGTYNRIVREFKDPYSFFDVGLGGYYVDPSTGKYVFPNLKMAPNTLVVQD